MRARFTGPLLLLAAALALLPLRGQDRPPADPHVRPASFPADRAQPAPRAAATTFAGLDYDKLPRLHQQFALSAARAADWLARLNGDKGRFLHGLRPDLAVVVEGDSFLRQAGAAYALARAARLSASEGHAARATQALLALFGETVPDPADPSARHTGLPSQAVSRLGAAGLLLAAVHELPNPPKDLVDQAEQLAQGVRRRARADGSLRCGDAADSGPDSTEERFGACEYPGPALFGVMRSQARRPAAWKLEVTRKALDYYLALWRKERCVALVPWHVAAFTEAYLLTKDEAYAAAVFEMCDWLCGLQYDAAQLGPQQAAWRGGFASARDGKRVEAPPDVGSAACAEALAQAGRVTRSRGDLTRHRRYAAAAEGCLQYLTTLQYTEGSTQHFADWYRPRLVGGFYASPQDGALRLDHTQHALCALLLFLEHTAR